MGSRGPISASNRKRPACRWAISIAAHAWQAWRLHWEQPPRTNISPPIANSSAKRFQLPADEAVPNNCVTAAASSCSMKKLSPI